MSTRAADDFDAIRARLKQLTEVTEVRRSGPGTPGDHCSHCPKELHEHCLLGCSAEAKKAGVII
jgi:hypothetical protein